MRTIWKFELELTRRQTIIIPHRHSFLHAGRDGAGGICLWAKIDSASPNCEMQIIIVGTGRELPDVGPHLGTVIDGEMVWHIFLGEDWL